MHSLHPRVTYPEIDYCWFAWEAFWDFWHSNTYLVGITENVGNTVYMNGSILVIRSSKYTLKVVEPFWYLAYTSLQGQRMNQNYQSQN